MYYLNIIEKADLFIEIFSLIGVLAPHCVYIYQIILEKQKREAIDVVLMRGELSMKDISKYLGLYLSTVYLVKSRDSNIVFLGLK